MKPCARRVFFQFGALVFFALVLRRPGAPLSGTGPVVPGFSKTGRTLYYRGQTFQRLKGRGFKSNYYCVETGEDYWISGPKCRGGDALYGGNTPIEIDEDVREEYWREIREEPERVRETVA